MTRAEKIEAEARIVIEHGYAPCECAGDVECPPYALRAALALPADEPRDMGIGWPGAPALFRDGFKAGVEAAAKVAEKRTAGDFMRDPYSEGWVRAALRIEQEIRALDDGGSR